MDKIYLVLNTNTNDGRAEKERWCLDICKDYETAEKLQQKYINNFLEYQEKCDFIEIEEVELSDKNIFWDYEGN